MNINTEIYEDLLSNHQKTIKLIKGSFATGKTSLLLNFQKHIIEKEKNTTIFYFDLINTKYFVEIPNAITVYVTEDLNGKINLSELLYFQNKYVELITSIENIPDLKSQILQTNKLISYFEYFTQKSLDDAQQKLIEAVENIFEKKADQRILLNFPQVLIESIIVELFKYHQSIKPQQKIKVLFIFDNYEKIAFSINHWLVKYFFNYLFKKSLKDLIAYSFDKALQDLPITSFCDSNFIIASRNSFFAKEIKSTEFIQNFKTLEMDYPCPEKFGIDVKQYIDSYPFMEKYSPQENTFASWLFHIFSTSTRTNIDEKNFLEFVTNQIKSQQTPSLFNIIEKLSCFDFFTEDALRIFDNRKNLHQFIFKYLSEDDDICKTYDFKLQSLKLNKQYKEIISASADFENKEEFNFLVQKAKTYCELIKKLPKQTFLERKIIRSLAYFQKFDLEEFLEINFAEDYLLAKDVIVSNLEFFEKGDGFLCLKPGLKEIYNEYNKIIDTEIYEAKMQFIREKYKQFKESLSKKLENLETTTKEKINRLKSIKQELKEISEKTEIIKPKIITIENEIISLERKHFGFTAKFYWLIFSILVLLALAFYFLGNNIYSIFDKLLPSEPIEGLGLTLKIFSIFILLILFIMLIKGLFLKDKRRALDQAKNLIHNLETEKSSLSSELKVLAENKNELIKQQKELESSISYNQSEINRLKKKLEIEFI